MSVWDHKFPTFVGGSPSAKIAQPSESVLARRPRPNSSTFPLRPGTTPSHDAPRACSKLRPVDDPLPPGGSKSLVDVSLVSLASSTSAETRSAPTSAPAAQQRALSPGGSKDAARAPKLNFALLRAKRDAQTTDDTGYDRLLASIERVHSNLEHVPLHQRWLAMAQWLDRYSYDGVADHLCTNAADLHRSVVTATSDRPAVNGQRTAISFMLLEQILQVVAHTYPRLMPVVDTVRDDILAAVYVSPDTPLDYSGSFFLIEDVSDPAQQLALIKR
jgi:hypothetical protein